MQKDIAFLVVTYNCLKYTKKLYYTTKIPKNGVWFFYDNNSTDGTREWLASIAHRKNVYCIYKGFNTGVAVSWNCGIDDAFTLFNAKYVFVLNNDILLHDRTIWQMLSILEAGNYHFVTATNISDKVALPSDITNFPLPEKELLTECPDFSCFALDRFAFHTIGSFDEKFYPAYFEDNDYHYRAKLLKVPLVKFNCALFYHFGSRTLRENADIEQKVSETYLKNEAYFIEKWGGKPGQEVYKKPFNDIV